MAHARRALPALIRCDEAELVFLDELSQCNRLGWTFFCVDRQRLDSTDQSNGATSGAVVVMHDGRVRTSDYAHQAEGLMAELSRAGMGA